MILYQMWHASNMPLESLTADVGSKIKLLNQNCEMKID